MACDYTDDCATCQAYLCAKSCKYDGARSGVEPAVTEYGAHLLAECQVLRLESDRNRVQQVICQRHSDMLTLKAKVVVLAAGALATPVLLLNSRSGDWSRGLANGSDMVGRNLMRHIMDWIEVWPQRGSKITAENKEIGLNDFYFIDGQKYGTVQSAGSMASLAPIDMMMNQPGLVAKALRLAGPAARPIYDRLINGGLVLAAIMEDLPYLDNRILPSDRPSIDGRQRLRLQYRLHPSEVERRKVFLPALKEVLQPFRTLTLRTGANNATLGHVCGTARFGTDPATSVLNPQNRAHEVENLYVVDASFFPSSTGINPSLTIAANALRVAEHINGAHFAS
jgi:choline dehydrogenase-like flavoprotein